MSADNNFHRRIVVFSYFEDEIEKMNKLPRAEMERAVGRLVLWNLANAQGQDTAQVVNISPCYGSEMQAAYFPRQPLKDCEYSVNNMLAGMCRGQAFVMGAVYREGEKKFSFHS